MLRIQDINVDNLTVLVRVDYNVPIENGKVLDDSKIQASLKTINYLKEHNSKIILLSHLGKIKTAEDKKKNSLLPICHKLSEILGEEVKFYNDENKNKVYQIVKKLKNKEILILENTRFNDLDGNLESNCDIQLSMFYASLANVFINDAFASSHRSHASTVGITKFLPSGIGFCVQKEIEKLDVIKNVKEHPFTIIMGGAKVDDKIPVIKSLIEKCDYLILSGGIANTFLKSLGINIGFSLYNEKYLNEVMEILHNFKQKIFLPVDVIVGKKYDSNYADYKLVNEVTKDEMILDIGPKTIEKYKNIIAGSKTIFMNGTIGKYEDKKFSNGTREIFNILSKTNAKVVIGGGDSVGAANALGYKNSFYYLSTGGGATLEYLAKGSLVALDALKKE